MALGTRTVGQVRQATALLVAASNALATLGADEAITVAEAFAQAEKAAMAGARRAVLCAGDEGARRCGGERDMAALAARLTGTTRSRAKVGLQSAQRAASHQEVEKAYVAGSLSFDQVAVVTDAAAEVPGVAASLVLEAERSALSGLRASAAAARMAKAGEEAAMAREQRVVARRFCRIGALPEGGVRLEALLPTEEGARVQRAVEAATDRCWRGARERGQTLSIDHARADALVGLLAGRGVAASRGGPSRSRAGASGGEPCGGGEACGCGNLCGCGDSCGCGEAGMPPPNPPELVVTVDAAALVRGEVHPGESCVIEGIGPISVTAARGLLGEALLTLCVRDGKDVRTVTSTSRVVPSRVRKALLLRDPTCVIPGCGQRLHLEIDHWRLDFSRGGLTAVDNLCRLCASHHRLKTRTGWRLEGGPGRWRWLPPRRTAGSDARRRNRPPGTTPGAARSPARAGDQVHPVLRQ
jgi:hypothetical protein